LTKLSQKTVIAFRKKIYSHYKKNGRVFPWRKTKNPYRILVSEIMLQQTQVSRVIPYYQSFLKRFPTIQSLEKGTNREVFEAWQGLGYNRRALYLKRLAEIVNNRYDNKIPTDHNALIKLPGVGPNTAGAILAFAFNRPTVFIETNIRSVFIHEFFPRRKKISDAELLFYIEQTLDRKNPRLWYWALMDYGVMLKAKYPNPSRKSRHHLRQSPFKGSDRELRGEILHLLLQKTYREQALEKKLDKAPGRIKKIIATLLKEKLIQKRGNFFYID